MSRQLKLVLIISILASFVAFLDSSVVGVALPAIVRELGGGLGVQQWVTDAYLITLGALILLAGSLSDLFGRKKILAMGLVGFGLTSLLCAVAPTNTLLIIARGLQGASGALLVPSSLALIIANFSGKPQSKAIGTWTAWTGMSFLIGPLVGGFLVDSYSWRFIFAINILPILLCLFLIARLEREDKTSHPRLDIRGAILCTIGLFGVVYALIEQPQYGWLSPFIFGPLVVGIVSLIAFVWYERRTANPMLPLSLFEVRNFSAGNIATIVIYGGLSVATFLIVIFLQQVGHYSALSAGLALVPVTVIMFFLSSYFGKLAGKFGPRLFMTFGPIVAGIGFVLMLSVSEQVSYVSQLLPGVLVFGLGLSVTVAPLTSAVLGDVDKAHSGVASAVNNAIARIAGLVAIAAVGVVVGSQITLVSFHRAIFVTAILLVAGGVISFIGIRNHELSDH